MWMSFEKLLMLGIFAQVSFQRFPIEVSVSSQDTKVVGCNLNFSRRPHICHFLPTKVASSFSTVVSSVISDVLSLSDTLHHSR
jgi:hypothetical protein